MQQIHYYEASTGKNLPTDYPNTHLSSNLRKSGELPQQIQYQPINPQYNPSNSPYIQNANIQHNIAAGSAQWVESMYTNARPSTQQVTSIPLQSNQHLKEQINYLPPHSERRLIGGDAMPQVPQVHPAITNIRPYSSKQKQFNCSQFCWSCCPFGNTSAMGGHSKTSKGWSSQCCSPGGMCGFCPCANSVPPNKPSVPMPGLPPNSSYFVQTAPPNANINNPASNQSFNQSFSSDVRCGCSRGMNPAFFRSSYNPPGVGYHGIGYDMIGPYCCDGPGGWKSASPMFGQSNSAQRSNGGVCDCLKGTIFPCC